MAKVFITRKIPQIGIDLLKKKHAVRVYPKDQVIPRKELLNAVKWCDALLCLLTDKIDKELLEINPKLKIISNYAVGFNNIDVKTATAKGIPVTNTPGVLTDAVAEHTLALMLAVSKRIVESDKYLRAGKYKSWAPLLLLGTQLKGKILGVIGLGRIGSEVAAKAQAMGMKIVYYDIKADKEFEKKFQAKFFSIPQLLKLSDFVSIHVPLLPTTTHLLSTKEFALMKKTAYLINTSRGPVIDEKALVIALQKKQIAGAGLDVFEFEPKLVPGLAKLDNVVITPHTASATIEARSAMAEMAAKNIMEVLAGRQGSTTVNPEVYK